MRILQINACHYHRGGSEMVYFNTSELLIKHGHEVIYFSTKHTYNVKSKFETYFVSNGNVRELSFIGKLKRVPSYLYNWRASRQIEKLIKDHKPQVAHVHIFYAELSVSILKVLKKYKIPIVHTAHDYRLLCPVNTLIDNNGSVCELCKDRHYSHCIKKKCSEGKITQSSIVALEAYFWKYLQNPLKFIDHYIFVSNFSMGKHLEFNNFFTNKHTRLYNFTHYTENSDYKLTKGYYYLYFGRLSVEKGVKTLIAAFSDNRTYKLKIAGTGPLKDIVEKASKENDNIEYVGFQSGNDLKDLIINSSFVVMPSECYENNPMSVVEAYSLGKPVIGSRIAGIPELVQEGLNGFLFESGSKDSLLRAVVESSLIDSSEYEGYSRSVFEFSKSCFDIDKHYNNLIEIYTNVINKVKSE